MTETEILKGRILKSVGGHFTVRRAGSTETIECRAKGAFRHEGATPLPGDTVTVRLSVRAQTETRDKDALIETIDERASVLPRPPVANASFLLVTVAVASPDPLFLSIDKLLAVAAYRKVEPILIFSKTDLSPAVAEEYVSLYRKAGFTVFSVCTLPGKEEGVEELRRFILTEIAERGKIAAVAGASGVGKSTLLNSLFPQLCLETGEVSRKTERGKQTTRQTVLYPFDAAQPDTGYIADTPGFSSLDVERADLFSKEDLPGLMREFSPYLGCCRYRKCTHTKEEGCAILEAVRSGEIAKSRHVSFVAMFDVLKNVHDWDRTT